MVVATSNRLLPLLAGAVVLMLVFVGLKSCSGDATDSPVLEQVPQAPAPDADTPADTIKTLTANVAAMTAQVEALRRDNESLRRENQELLTSRTRIEENVTTKLKRELLAREHDKEARQRLDQGLLSSLTTRMDALSQSIAQSDTTSDIPVGLGLDGIGVGPSEEPLVWIDPLDAPDSGPVKGHNLLNRAHQSVSGALESATKQGGTMAGGLRRRIGLPATRPVYTVPRNATLIGSTAMTALVGRVPVHRARCVTPCPSR
jgi:integrating conjugative element protein (TIGR03752 family)